MLQCVLQCVLPCVLQCTSEKTVTEISCAYTWINVSAYRVDTCVCIVCGECVVVCVAVCVVVHV